MAAVVVEVASGEDLAATIRVERTDRASHCRGSQFVILGMNKTVTMGDMS